MDIIVTNSTELYYALHQASGGDTILLKGDEPFTINSSGGINPTSNVTITSFDPENPSTITTLTLAKAENLVFDGLIFDSSSDGTTRANHLNDLNISGCSNITIQNSDMFGTAEGPLTLDGEYAKAETLGTVKNTDGFVFTNNTVSNYNFGLTITESTNLTISNSEFSELQGDPLRFGGVQDVLIEGNYIHDLYGSDYKLNHMDMIQIWSTQTTLVTQNVTITGNVLDAGDGAGTQSIFIRNEKVDAAGDEYLDLYYKNITITDNVIYNGDSHGITVGQTDGVIISNNTLITNDEANVIAGTSTDKLTSPLIHVVDSAVNVQITDNVSAGVSGPESALIEGNFIVDYSNPLADNYVANVFIAAADGGSVGLEGLAFNPNGPLGGVNIGADFSQFISTPDELTPVFTYSTVDGSESVYRFDGRLTAAADGFVGDEDATFEWTFADGTKAYGAVIEHDFGASGLQDVTLSVSLKDGSAAAETSREVDVRDPVLFQISAVNGLVEDISSFASNLTVKAQSTTDGFHVTSGQAILVDRSNDQIFNLEQFTLSLGVQRDSATEGYGVLAGIHQSFKLVLNSKGELEFTLTNAEGSQYKLVTQGASIDDTDWHKVTLSFDGRGGEAEIFVDGKSVGSIDVDGTTAARVYWGLTIGSEWSGSFSGLVDDIRMTADPTTAEQAAQDAQNFLTWKAADLDSPFLHFVAATETNIALDSDDDGITLVESYDHGIQDKGQVVIGEDGASVTLQGNAWKALNVAGSIDADTVIRFEFTVEKAGEIHAISFANDGIATPENTFQLFGSQTYGIQNFRAAYSEVGSTVTVEIPVGQYLKGTFDKIVLIGDDDASSSASAIFANIEILGGTDVADGASENKLSGHLISLESYGDFLQDAGNATVSADGRDIELTGNAWKFIDQALEIDGDSTLKFSLSGDDDGEIQAIGFLRDGKLDESSIFQLGGSQKYGIQDFNGLSGLDNGTVDYSLEVGKYLQGAYDGIVLIADDDFDASGHTIFSDLEFFA